jgi:hypothetical protein
MPRECGLEVGKDYCSLLQTLHTLRFILFSLIQHWYVTSVVKCYCFTDNFGSRLSSLLKLHS